MKDITFPEHSSSLIEQLPKGAFLTVKAGNQANVMTIGWGTIGVAWGKPVLNVMVRYNRFTYELLEKTTEFTLSVPLHNQLQKELGICGAKSGRELDKFREAGLTAVPGKQVLTPIVGECDLFYECKIIYRQAMEPIAVPADIQEKYYTNRVYHVFFSGEVVASYCKE